MIRRSFPPAIALLLLGAALAQDPPALAPFTAQLLLVRHDMPRGLSDGYAPTRQLAVRRGGSDAIEWPAFTLNGQPLWQTKADERVPLRLRKGAEAMPPFAAPGDDAIEPGGHWLRAVQWAGNRTYIYTADRTARAGSAVVAPQGRYELWTWPLLIKGEGGPVVKLVELRYEGRLIYKKDGPWRSLTLLLPASEKGKQYELHIAGRPAMKFNVGLAPVKPGDPQERVIGFHAPLAGEGPKIVVSLPTRREIFPGQEEWEADLAALAHAQPERFAFDRGPGIGKYVGIEVPRSPFTIYAAALPHGMSGGFFKKGTNPEDYAAMVADAGYDAIFDPANSIPPPSDTESFEKRAAALARRGVKLGLQYDNNWTRPSLQNPNLPILAHTLPDWHAPLYRSLSLTAQRFSRLPNFLGIEIGADNAGYAASWFWAPPLPDRPWGEAMIDFMGTPQPRIPRGPSLGPATFPFETPVKTTAEFLKYADRFDASFQEYSYVAEAVREVSPGAIFTTASFGSTAGAGARGGWPSGSVPGRAFFQGLTTQQAYDWNDKHAAQPLYNVALIDRLHSYTPKKRTWALLDDYHFLYGREPFQRAVAIELTRGIQALGTNFLPSPSGEGARPDVLAWRRDLFSWIHRYGGVYARMEPEAPIGIFYSHQQALLRPAVRGETTTDPFAGSHEGKVLEALFLCHAAGWPARVVTFQEVAGGPLPRSMKALLLVGLDQPDASWNWAPGLAPMLQQFLDGGGRILSDEESYCPVPATRAGLRVAAYVAAGNLDPTPLLIARNADNIAKLRAAMQGAPEPSAVSESPTVWAIPSRSGHVKYVTVVNQASAQGDEAREMLGPADPKATKPEVWKTKANASLYAQPQTGELRWNTRRPIYDVRLGKKVTRAEASTVDLTKDAFQFYALPPAEVVAPEIVVEKSISGFYDAKLAMNHPMPMLGIPVKVDIVAEKESATVFSATGASARLPLHAGQTPGSFTITATELLTGLSTTTQLTITLPEPAETIRGSVRVREAAVVKKFAERKLIPLSVVLTPEQMRDATVAQ